MVYLLFFSFILFFSSSTNYGKTDQLEALKLLEAFIAGDVPQGVVDVILFPEVHNTLLLYGPEGTGKTTIVQALAAIKNAELIHISGGSIVTEYQGSGAGFIDSLFQRAEKLAYKKMSTLIFIDEIDAIAKNRSLNSQNNEHSNALLSLGVHLENLEKSKSLKPYIFFAAATNRYTNLDTFFLSRMKNKIEIGLPDCTTRKKIIEKIVNHENHLLSDAFIKELATKTDLFSGRDLEALFKKARCNRLREQSQVLLEKHIKLELLPIQKDVQLLTNKRKLLERKDKDELEEQSFLVKHHQTIISAGVGIVGLLLSYYIYMQNNKTRELDFIRAENQQIAAQAFQRELMQEAQKASIPTAVQTAAAVREGLGWPRYLWDAGWDIGKSVASTLLGGGFGKLLGLG